MRNNGKGGCRCQDSTFGKGKWNNERVKRSRKTYTLYSKPAARKKTNELREFLPYATESPRNENPCRR
jgi:hypothetical protein